ncbi:kinase-like domain-containing protein [Astrocystis sublimbata]|nr:kinase-like domain-containing protein [Astrocystis sublimbata]
MNKFTSKVYAVKECYRTGRHAETELPALLDFDYENLIKYHKFYHDPVAVVMDYGGDNLEVDHGCTPLSNLEARDCLYQLLRAVRYLHQKGHTHRDMKPENIFVHQRLPTDHRIHVKLGDLGLASSMKWMETRCGTIAYLAPEVLAEEYYYTNKVDMYSLGSMFDLLAFGRKKRKRDDDDDSDNDSDDKSSRLKQLIASLKEPEPSQRADAQEALGNSMFAAGHPFEAPLFRRVDLEK